MKVKVNVGLTGLRHSTGNVRIHIGDFFLNLSYLGTFMQNGYTHIHIHTQRETGVMTIGKILKTDLPKISHADVIIAKVTCRFDNS